MFREYWEYCAMTTPYWRTIFDKHGAKFEDGHKRIVFDTEELEEAFYEIYGYETDEQSEIVQQYCLGGGQVPQYK
jgi:hypothetical protein